MDITRLLVTPDDTEKFIRQVLTAAVDGGADNAAASDIFIVAGAGIAFKRKGKLNWPYGDGKPNDKIPWMIPARTRRRGSGSRRKNGKTAV